MAKREGSADEFVARKSDLGLRYDALAGIGERRTPDMANHGVGTKYVSVNLNKSYGQQPHHHYNHSGGYGTNRGRTGGYGSGGGGGSMVVLSRPRSSQKAGAKLSVPPPLNLPSLRKEHERIDSLGSSVHSAGGMPGGGSRPASSGMGWSKPATTAALQEKERLDGDDVDGAVKGVGKGTNGLYMPPVARPGAPEPLERAFPPVEKAATLRGEDFPSLKATLPAVSAPGQKQKEGLNQKQKQAAGEELRGVSGVNSSLVDMRPQSHNRVGFELSESPSFLDGSRSSQQLRKDYFPGPLPIVRLNPRSDWADDERDTSHGLKDWDRDHGYSKNESLWDRDFDVPRQSVLPHKPPAAHSHYDRPGKRENDTGKSSLAQARPASGGREANTWRMSSPLQNEVETDRNIGGGARPSSRGREVVMENKYISSPLRDSAWNNTGTREASYQLGGRQPWNNDMNSSSNRGTFTKDGYRNEHQNRDKRLFFKSDKPQREDPFIKDFGDAGFDLHDPFPVLGMAKKKKEALKQTDFHDPVRESFEAELERVQKMQEEERRRIIEEQERAMELARREEEERLRLVREQEEQQRKLEEEAREAAWRTEQERLEATRRAEELKKSKEEEKRRIFVEEERRKQAAKQKLLELEEKIAKRQAEAAKGCSSSSSVSEDKGLEIVKEKELPRAMDMADWEDGERMVERITTSSTFDLPVSTRSFENNSVPHFSRDGSSVFPDRQKPSSWRKENIESGSNSKFISPDMEIVPRSPQRDASGVFPKKEFFGTAGYMTGKSYFKPGYPETSLDQSWRIPGDESLYARNGGMGSEFREGFGEHYGDPGWGQGQGRSRGHPYSPYPEKLYQNPEGDDYYPFGRSRFSVRQPRVLPPPSMASMQKSSFRSEVDRAGPSNSVESGGMTYNQAIRTESAAQATYDRDLQDNHGRQSGSNRNEHHRFNSKIAGRCESQSSLSVSSPPDSPVHLSHDDFDESGDSSVLAGSRKGKDTTLLEKGGEPIISAVAGKDSLMIATGSMSCGDDDEWTLDNNEHLQEQEEYDEDEDAYQEEDEIHGGDEDNIDLVQDFEAMRLQEKDSNLVLGFNEGVEVEIPSDDFEKGQHNKEAAFALPQHSADSVDGERSNETSSSGQGTRPLETPGQVKIVNSSGGLLETETKLQNLAIQLNCDLQSPRLSESVDRVESLSNSVISAQPGLPSLNMGMHSPTVHMSVPPAGSAPAQTEEPVKLQFGLFSGPSLIPSPVPAIQIGSIQMPLPFHPHFGTSLTHMQQSQPPIFQFGQVRYASPISQGVLPLPPHSIVHPSASSSFQLNQNSGPTMTVQLGQGNSANTLVKNEAISLSDPQSNVVTRQIDISSGNTLKSANLFPAAARNETVLSSQKQGELSSKSESPSQVTVNGKPNSVDRQSECQVQIATTTQISVSKDKDTSGLRAHGQSYGPRGKRDAFAVKNSGFRSSGLPEVSRADSGGYRRYRRQRVEFRVRESNRPSLEENVHANGRAPQNSTRNGARKFVVSNKSLKQTLDSDGSGSGSTAPVKTDTGSRTENGNGKDAIIKSQQIPSPGQTNLKRNLISEDIDAPLQSGIVRVFEQPGIEAPSDDDDFIEVRSKRQMLNDRREQREKEIKAKSQANKASRKPRSTLQNTAVADRSSKIPSISGPANNKQSNPVTNKQPLAPIGTPAHRGDGHADAKSGTSNRSSQVSAAVPVMSRSEQNPATSFMFNNKNKVLNNIQTSVGSWGNSRSDQPVMALTQSQLDEAMKPVSFDSCVSVEDRANLISEPSPASTSVLPKNNFPTGTSPINSLLSGGKIQFGAVSSSTVLPPCGRTENNCSLFFEKDKHINPSTGHMEVCEAEAEAAASAIAVAAITSDEVGENTVGPGSVSGVETKIFGGAELDGAAGNGEQPSQLKAEESLSVSLPADLSVDTPPISLWPPPLPSPHNSNQLISHFPPGPPHYPFYDMNPMLRGPIFAFGPHDESGSNQSQSQKGTGTVSGPPATWQQGHSSVESFYAPPSGFTGAFLTPPGGIPGVQAPPHMFFYNHFAPVGQFGQVGLSFMGTAYIPSGKQPDWKHNQVSSAPIAGEGDANNSNVASMQHNPVVIPTSGQHLSPGSSLLPMPSPLAMFDVPPFQSSQELPIQARWPHMPGPALQQTPPSMSLQQQQQIEGPNIPSQYNNMVPPNQAVAPNRFHNSQTSVISDATASQLSDELGLADSSNSYGFSAPPQKVTTFPITAAEANAPSGDVQNTNGSGFKQPPQSSQQKNTSSQHFGGSSGYNNHQRGASQRGNNNSGSGNEWPQNHHHRRSGFHSRNQSAGGEKGFSNAKVKQIYVAKQTASSGASASNTNAAATTTKSAASS